MLHQFLFDNRQALIERCRAKVAERPAHNANSMESEHGVPMFLGQLIKTLRVEQDGDAEQSRAVSGASGGVGSALSEVGETASLHGRELLQQGFTLEQVVHDYGDLCQAVTELAFERSLEIDIDEFHTLNRCLDNAIADAVTAFSEGRDFIVAGRNADALNQRLGVFAHELRNFVQTALLATHAIKAGAVGVGGATGAILDRSLLGMSHLIDRSLAEVKMAAEMPAQHEVFLLAGFIAEVRVAASLQAQLRECALMVPVVDPELTLNADRELLFSALGNLLQNAFKFTRHGSEVTLSAHRQGERILIEVSDEGEGLPPGEAEKMFAPFTQGGEDKSGLGLGLSIARRSVEANDGVLSVQSVAGEGCVFTIDLPRYVAPEVVALPAQRRVENAIPQS